MIESLETRKMFAVTLTNGVLEIVGTDSGDVIRVTQFVKGTKSSLGTGLSTIAVTDATVNVRVNGERFDFDADDVKAIKIAAGAGDDAVRVEAASQIRISLPIGTGVAGEEVRLDASTSKPVSIDGGAGNDALTGGDGPDTIRGGEGNDTIFGGNGRDKLFGNAGQDRLIDTGSLDTYIGGDGGDTYEIRGGRARLSLDGNDADSTVVVTGAPVRLFNLAGELIVNSDGRDDEFVVG